MALVKKEAGRYLPPIQIVLGGDQDFGVRISFSLPYQLGGMVVFNAYADLVELEDAIKQTVCYRLSDNKNAYPTFSPVLEFARWLGGESLKNRLQEEIENWIPKYLKVFRESEQGRKDARENYALWEQVLEQPVAENRLSLRISEDRCWPSANVIVGDKTYSFSGDYILGKWLRANAGQLGGWGGVSSVTRKASEKHLPYFEISDPIAIRKILEKFCEWLKDRLDWHLRFLDRHSSYREWAFRYWSTIPKTATDGRYTDEAYWRMGGVLPSDWPPTKDPVEIAWYTEELEKIRQTTDLEPEQEIILPFPQVLDLLRFVECGYDSSSYGSLDKGILFAPPNIYSRSKSCWIQMGRETAICFHRMNEDSLLAIWEERGRKAMGALKSLLELEIRHTFSLAAAGVVASALLVLQNRMTGSSHQRF